MDLRKISKLLAENLTVSVIMTRRLYLASYKDTVGDHVEKLREKGFSILPIRRNGQIKYYARLDDLEKAPPSTPLSDVCLPITEDVVLSPSTLLSQLLEKLTENDFYFIKEERNIIGIVTYADLNNRGVKLLFYPLLIELESLLSSLVRSKYDSDSLLKRFGNVIRSESIGNWMKDRLKDVDAHLVEYLCFSELVEILGQDKELRDRLGFKSKSEVDKELRGLNELRNRVMHAPRSLIRSRDEVGRLNEWYHKLERILLSRMEYMR